MKTRLIVATLIIFNIIRINAQEQKQEFTCGRRLVKHEGLITNGLQSNEGDWPWHAALYHISNVDKKIAYVCGGSLLNVNSVLTAAHCVYLNEKAVSPEIILVRLGKYKLIVSGTHSQDFQAYNIILHPDYNTADQSNDIAIIRLSTEATFNDFVQPICLWDSNKVALSEVIGKFGTVIGWGITQSDHLANILQYAVIPVIPSLTCLKSNRPFFGSFLSDHNFCAGFQNGTGACNGDSGGSLSFEENGIYYIRGIVSLAAARKGNAQLCDTQNYVLFTDVAQYLPWIQEVVPQLIQPQTELVKMEPGVVEVDDSISLITGRCYKKVNCFEKNYWERGLICKVQIQLEPSEEKCNIIFDEDTDADVIVLTLTGKIDSFPVLTNALEKFANIEYIDVGFLQIKSVERNKLAIVKQINRLSFYGNIISELSPDTFDDLKNMKILLLAENRLKVIHRDLFKELKYLSQLWLQKNQIEVLPEGLFRNNKDLKEVFAGENKLKTIRIDFINLPNLSYIDLKENVCINEFCQVTNFCQTTSIEEMQSKIWGQC